MNAPEQLVDMIRASIAPEEKERNLRDWFAGMALQGLCMNPPTETEALTDCASLALNIADAMLAARKEAR